ncbi:type II toxin-antitoxin system HicB family antitoxin [Spirosoma areae]
MIAEFIQAALRRAHYELEEGMFYADVPELPGVLAYGSTVEECRNQLVEVIEGWLLVGIRHGDVIPALLV